MADNRRLEEAMELVYFIFPTCDGQCAHCWSSDIKLGYFKDTAWHGKMLDALAEKNYKYKEIKLSGGEPFFHLGIGEIAEMIHEKLGKDIPITIFTSGRPFVSLESGRKGIERTKNNIKKCITNFDNLAIHMSADEFHLDVLCRKHHWSEVEAKANFKTYVSNFILACEEIKQEEKGFLGAKLKIHCAEGRKNYHKEELFDWFPLEWWQEYAILTEGLVYAGNGKNLEHTFKLEPNDMISYFLLPGVDFYESPLTQNAELFYNQESDKIMYLDYSDECSVIIPGWWNLIDRKLVYQCVYKK